MSILASQQAQAWGSIIMWVVIIVWQQQKLPYPNAESSNCSNRETGRSSRSKRNQREEIR